jgi:hypothetical protein
MNFIIDSNSTNTSSTITSGLYENSIITSLNTNISNTSNYASNISNVIIVNNSNFTSGTAVNTSNYAFNISNILVGAINTGGGGSSSNYASNISNVIIANNSNFTIGTGTNTSNYASNISNILTMRDASNLTNTSNYASNISNIIIANNSNFTIGTGTNTSNYASNISNIIIANNSNFTLGTGTNTSNYASNISNIIIANNSNFTLGTGTNTSNYASNISNILTIRDASNLINTSNYATNISNILLANINATANANTTFLKLDGTNTMTGSIITNSITGGNLISLNTTETNTTTSISFKNNLPIFGYLGLGCSANTTNYASNLFIETNYDILINPGGYSATPKMIVKSNGNIGIGTTNPLEALHVTGVIASINSSKHDHVRFFNNGYTAFFDAGGAESGIAFRINSSGGNVYPASSYNEIMRLLPNGNVGIGTTPSYMFDVYSDNSTINNAIRIRSHTSREATLILERTGSIWQILNKGSGFIGTASNLSFASSTKSEILEITPAGNVGIGNPTPIGMLSIGRPDIVNDGSLTISKRSSAANFRNFKMGYDDNFNFCMGDFSNTTSVNTWTSNQFNINWINGNIGIGITGQTQKLYVNGTSYFNDTLTCLNTISAATINEGGSTLSSKYASKTTDITNTSNYATNISNILLTNINAITNANTTFLKLDGTNTMTGPILTNSITGGNLISLNTTSTTTTTAISFKNNLPIFGYLGLGCSANTTNYASNLFLETTYDIIINPGGYSATPKMIITSNGNIGIGTTNPQYKLQVGTGFLKLGDGNKTIIGVRDTDVNEDSPSGINTRIALYDIGSGFASGHICYFASGTAGRHIFYANSSTIFSINPDGFIKGVGNTILFDNYGNVYNNGTQVDFTSYATKNTDIFNTSNYATNISNIVIANNSNFTLGASLNTSNYASNISNILTIRDASNLINTSNYASNISNVLLTNISLNTSNYASNISNILVAAIGTGSGAGSSNYASNVSNVLLTNINANFLKLSGGAMTGQITGVTTLNGTTGIFGTLATTNNIANTAIPSTGSTGGVGDKIILYPGGVGFHPYSIGIAPNNLWYSATAGASHNFYIGGGNAKMSISSSGNVAIGTINNISSKLTINDIVVDRWLYDHSTSPLTVTNQTPTGTTLNDPQPILNLCRQGVPSVAYGARATFKLCRYENVDINSKTRLDISLAHTNYQTETNVMTLRSDGNVGIGLTNPIHEMHIRGATPAVLRIETNIDNFNQTSGIEFGIPAFNSTASAKILSTTIAGNKANLQFYTPSGAVNGSTERMRITETGAVTIGTTTPTSENTKLTIVGSSSTYSQPLVQITQNAGWDGNYALQVSGYTNLGGFRINGADTGNSLYQSLPETDFGFGQHAANSTGGNIKFFAQGGGGNIIFNTFGSTERLKISSDGNIIIGAANTSRKNIQFGESLNNNLAVAIAANDYSSSSAIGDMILRSHGKLLLQSGTGATAMTISTTNNICIGTTNPKTKLHIEHNSNIFSPSTGGLYVYNPNNTSGNCSVLGVGVGGTLADKAGISLGIGPTGTSGWSMFTIGTDTTDKKLVFNPTSDGSGANLLTIRGNDGLITFTGALNFPTGVWNKSSDNVLRLNYGINGPTYFQSGNTTGNSFIFKNQTSTAEIFSIDNIGNISLGSGNTNDYQLLINPPISTTAASIQTIQQGVNYNQNLLLQPTAGNVGIGTNDPSTFKLSVNGDTYINGLLNINATNASSGGTKGIIFRNGYNVAGTNIYNCSILTYDHTGDVVSSDGLSINGWDGISFCTGANTRNERMRITSTGKVGIGTTDPGNSVLTLYSTTQTLPRLLLSGTEFYSNTFTSASGIVLLLGVNRDDNRQLWIADSTKLAINTTNPVLRLMPNTIDCVATNGITPLPLNIGNSALTTIGGSLSVNGVINGNGSNITAINYNNITQNPLIFNTPISKNVNNIVSLNLDNQSVIRYPPIGLDAFSGSVGVIIVADSSGVTNTIINSSYNNNGIYRVISSSTATATAYYCFDYIDNNPWIPTSAFYRTTAPFDYTLTSTSTIINGISNIYGEWVQLYYDKGFVATSISIIGTTLINSPSAFILAGSTDESNWTLLSQQSGISTLSNTFNINNYTSYTYYRTIFTNTIGSSELQIGEIKFYGLPNSTYVNNDNFNQIIYNTTEKQFPPRIYDIAREETTYSLNVGNELFGVLPIMIYKQELILNNHGTYTIYSSSSIGSDYKNLLFNYNINIETEGTIGSTWDLANYTNGIYNEAFTYYIKSDYKGDWIIVKFPYKIVLTRFRFYYSTINNAPGSWKCYGSNDGINFTEITEASNTQIRLTANNYALGYFEDIISSTFDIPYLYIGWVVNKLVGLVDNLCFLELQIFGKDDISNSYSKALTLLPDNRLIYNNTSNIITYTSTTSVDLANKYVRFNYSDEVYFNSGTYTITFTTGSHSINSTPGIIKYTYPILKDSALNIINPLIWYKFDNSPGLLIDSGSLNNGSLTNNGVIQNLNTLNLIHGNGSASFTLSTTFLTIPNTIDLNAINLSTGISFSLWVYISSHILNGSTGYGRIFDFGKIIGSSGSNYILITANATSQQLKFEIQNSTGPTVKSFITTGNYFGSWYNITWTILKSGEWSIYINNIALLINNFVQSNGSPLGTLSGTGTGIITRIPTVSERSYYIGRSLFSGDGKLNMYLDDFRIYGKILSATEVSELYTGRVEVYTKNNIGIGITNPNLNYILDVNGNTNLSGQLLIQNNYTTFSQSTGGLYIYNPNNTSGNCSLLGLAIGGTLADKVGLSLGIGSTGTSGWSIYTTGTDATNTLILSPFSDGSGAARLTIRGNDGYTTINGNIDCEGGIAIKGNNAFYSVDPINTITSTNLTNTYLSLKEAGSVNDWCYLRQIGSSDAYKLAFDFYDNIDANFCLRSIVSSADPDTITEVFNVNNGNISCTGTITNTGFIGTTRTTFHTSDGLNGQYKICFYSTNNIGIGGNPGHNLNFGNFSANDNTSFSPLMTLNTSTGRFSLSNLIARDRLILWDTGTSFFGFGIAADTLQYTTVGNHDFYNNTTVNMRLNTSGNLFVRGDISAFASASLSDRRLKHNINPLSLNCIDLINKIEAVEFDWNDMEEIIETRRNTHDHGFIAQDIEILLPHIVSQFDKYKSIKYDKLTPYLVKGIQELYKIIHEQKNQINIIKEYLNI